ncbi:membrane protein [Actinorhabdospora filicis]|uniref:Membrane protein n=1 Tax=Actinorhabdospora filicis TaxID=1785913 RepID=A0A9W6W9J0_9ACTN|nr:DUF6328 family protein [Actinorhabdospora filicis]GLZ76685.1 membrane protein [Actinorhabdospora filicis]
MDTGESEADRWKRNYHELLQELRVAQTGNQILFAFLLTVPFTQAFGTLVAYQRDVYVGTLLATGIATVLMITPVGMHRVLFRQGAKPQIVRLTSNLALAGLFFVLAAMSGALFLVVDMVVDRVWAAALAAVVVAVALAFWFGLPLWLRHRDR